MRVLPALLLLTLGLPSQADSLRRRVPDLLAHVSIPAGTSAPALRLRELCTDPGLVALAGSEAWRTPLSLLQGILVRSDGAVELALAALQPRADGTSVPLLILRLHLGTHAKELVQRVLTRRDLLGRGRVEHGRAIHEILGPGDNARAGSPLDQVGSVVELLLDGDDLLISNSATAISAWIEHGTASDGGASSTTPADEARLFVDWGRLAPRLGRLLESTGAPFEDALFWLAWSGIGGAEHATVTLRPAADGLRLGMHFAMAEQACPDGWLAAARSADPALLQAQLPAMDAHPGARPFAAFALAMDPRQLLAAPRGRMGGGRMLSMQGRMRVGARQLGLDLEQQVLSQLGSAVAVQLAVATGEGRVRPMFLLQTRSAKAAQRLVADLRGRLERLGMVVARIQPPAKGARTPAGPTHGGASESAESLHVRVPELGEVYLAAIDSNLVCAPDPALIEAWRARPRSDSSELTQRVAAAAAPFGVVALDLTQFASPGRPSSLLTHWRGTASLSDGVLSLDLFASTPR